MPRPLLTSLNVRKVLYEERKLDVEPQIARNSLKAKAQNVRKTYFLSKLPDV